MKILLTGGAGYIGTHTLVELLKDKHEVLIVDNFSNSSTIALDRVRSITGCDFEICDGDIRNKDTINHLFQRFKPDAVIHFAGLKSVSESVANPIAYYDVNVCGTLEILKAMKKVNCQKIIFSSSATVYGEPKYLPYDEYHPLNPTNPYGMSKLVVENLLNDWVKSNSENRAVCLRYFNPVGAHRSGLIGEDPQGIPSNIMPYISQVAVKKVPYLNIFGDNYTTRDGTGERDYIHVVDLAIFHVKALEKILDLNPFQALNLGTGNSTTVKELVKAFEDTSKEKIKIKIVNSRSGDVAKSWANSSLAEEALGYKCKFSILDMCRDAWRWQSRNPSGYK